MTTYRANGQACLVPASGYLRRSSGSKSQETSIPEQTAAIEHWAAEHGYRIVRWYTDDAISGDDTERRRAFLQMLEDAQHLRDFKTIICWDRARFGRFDSLEYGYYVHPLRKAGVTLATVMEGVTDWNDLNCRIVAGVTQEGKHQFLHDLSANVARGQSEAARNGSWLGSPPYGYRIEGKKKEKRLVLDDPGHVRVVQRIFREFTEEGRSLNNIAERLQSEGYASPGGKGKPWRYDTVKVILANPAYTGDYVGRRWRYGKYHTGDRDKVIKGSGRGKNQQERWVVRRDSHEPIVTREAFDRAQEILAKGKKGRSPYTPDDNPFILSGALRCGKCGCPLWGRNNDPFRYYFCSNNDHNGGGACPGTTVREDVVLRSIAEHLENWLGIDGDALSLTYSRIGRVVE